MRPTVSQSLISRKCSLVRELAQMLDFETSIFPFDTNEAALVGLIYRCGMDHEPLSCIERLRLEMEFLL
jgi:hypothetical protein